MNKYFILPVGFDYNGIDSNFFKAFKTFKEAKNFVQNKILPNEEADLLIIKKQDLKLYDDFYGIKEIYTELNML